MKLTKRFWIVVSIVLIIPIFTALVMTFIFFGSLDDVFKLLNYYRNNLSFNPETYPKLSDTINYLISGYSIIVTGIFSYVVWQTSIRNYQVAESVKELEENRDKETVRQSALIIFYELLSAFANLRDLYISRILENKNPNPSQLFFSQDWVKNIAALRDKLSPSEITEVHKLYSRFHTLKFFLESESERANLDAYIKDTVERVFASFLANEMLKNDFGDITIYLNRKYSIILSKIRIATYTANHISISVLPKEIQLSINNTPVYFGSMENNIFHGKGTLYTDEGLPKYEGTFHKGMFISGKVFGYYDDGEILYEIEYEEDIKKLGVLYKRSEIDHRIPYYFNGKFVGNHISDGITMEFHKNHAIKYEGSIQNEEYHGYGILYDSNGSVRYRGDFRHGEKINGELFGKGGYYFIGTFSNGLPWAGDVKKFSNHIVQNFTGSIVNGKPHTGEGLVFYRDQDGYDRRQLEVQDEIDYFEEEQYYREQEEWQQVQINQNSREKYERWDEYIKAKWDNGQIKEYEDKEINKRVYFDTNSQK